MDDTTKEPAIPDRYEMPDLSGLFPKNSLNIILLALIGQEPITSLLGRPRWINLVRLTDKAINEFEAARACLDEFAREHRHGRWSPLFRAIDHLENCVTATHRAFLWADALRRDPDVPKLDRDAFPRTYEIDRLNKLRDAIEHADEELKKGSLTPGIANILAPDEHGIELGAARVEFADLARWIEKAYGLVQALERPASA